jgi:hypothetical protein
MKCRTQVALAVGAGYFLGRTRKTKLALGLAAVAATGKFGGVSGQLVKRGTKLIGSSDALGKLAPQLTEVTELIRGDLVDAGKAAALSAVRGRIDNLSDRIQDQADAFREGKLPSTDDLPGTDDLLGGNGKPRRRRGAEEDDEDRPRRRRGGDARRRRRRDEEEPADYEDAEDFDETADEDEPVRDEDEPEPARDEEDEPEPVRDEDEPEPAGEEDEPEEEEPARPRRRAAASGSRRARSAAGGAPVRRARR